MSDVQDYPIEVNRWEVYEISLEGPASGNPFIEQRLQGIFTGKNESVVTEGFYDGAGVYKIRFMPSFSGRYSFILKGSFLDSTLSGRFVVNEAAEGNHGPVRTANTYHFSYEDGTAFNPVGTISNGWHVMFDGDIAESLKALKTSGFNKVRFSIFPHHDEYNLFDPQYFPYEGTPMSTHVLSKENVQEYTASKKGNHFDLSRFNTEYFRHLETCITELGKAGIEADLVLFHPYDRWGFASMSDKENDMYLSYVTNRLASYHNIWWSLADGWDVDQNKNLKDWEHYADLLVRRDPYHHLRSIHNSRKVYDSSRPWLTHASIHVDDLYKCAEYTDHYRIRFHKPIIMDDLGSEGNLPSGWNSLSPEELTRRFWETAMRGGYPGHSETYLDDPERIWSEHGVKLRGESWKRAVFLKQILDEVPGNGLAPMEADDCAACAPEAEYAQAVKSQYLYYFSFLRPAYRCFYIDDATDYVAEIIDTYAMKIKRFGIFHGSFKVELPCKPYLAVRLRKASEEDYQYVEPVEEEAPAAEEAVTEADAPKQEEETIPAFAEEPEAAEPEQEAPAEEAEEADASAETVKLPIEDEDYDVFEETAKVKEENEQAEIQIEETAKEAADETLEEPIISIKDELLEGSDESELDLSDIPEFLADDVEEPKEEKTNTDNIPASEEISEEEDDELPEIVEDSYLANQSAAGKQNKDTLNIPPISFGSDAKKPE
jgi:hypothetical protein